MVMNMAPGKRVVRLVVLLGVVVVLASALVYTSFSAASPALSPSELVRQARTGQAYQLTGTVAAGSRYCGSASRTGPAAGERRSCRLCTRGRCRIRSGKDAR
jgi:putative hemolysin